MSDKIKQKWGLLYWSQVMAMLDYAVGNPALCDISEQDIVHAKQMLTKYSYIYHGDFAPELSPNTPVRVVLSADAVETIGVLWGRMMAGNMPELVLPDSLDNKYVDAIRTAAEAYIAARAAKRTRDHDDCLVAIREYVSDCKSRGVKIIKKRVADRTRFSYDHVLSVWREFASLQDVSLNA